MEDKNQINLSGKQSDVTYPTYTPPTILTVVGPGSQPFVTQMVSVFTVPAGCIYFEGLLVAGGGAGGREAWNGATTLTWTSGGGGSGAWCRFRVTQTSFTAGSTMYQLNVGCGASNNALWTMANGAATDFNLFGGGMLTRVLGGNSGANDQFEGDGGNGGTLDAVFNNYVIEYGDGETGTKAKHFSPTIFATTAVSTGTGGWSAYGSPGRAVVYGNAQSDHGKNASGSGAGGGGCANDMLFGPKTFYGGTGAPGYAQIIFYYQ